MLSKLKKILAFLHYSPRRNQLAEALQFLKKITNNPKLIQLEGLVQAKILHAKEIQKNFTELCHIMTETLRDRPKMKLNKLIFHPFAGKEDSIHQENVKKLIELGLQQMEQSEDPFHDISHIYRCIRLAKLYFGFYRLSHKLDWGTMVLAAVFHDISRVKVGKSYLYYGKIPFLLDIYLIKKIISDAELSEIQFRTIAKTFKLPAKILRNAAIGILGTSFYAKDKAKSLQNNQYFKILSDVDRIDMFTIGRFEASLGNVLKFKMTTLKYFNRSTYLVSFISNKAENELKLKFSKGIFSLYKNSLNNYAKRFYPADAEIIGF